ncbi:Hypothetical_protein [Hexamita inflata]|uniref:Hypothetical_protein n=1 Tax=Hexamita inflata TaxID=28002 RepID=A0AA86RLD1_9EUKA|nr:Hypothetical protein HINF_LOCUS56200 [Hexamita inflata]
MAGCCRKGICAKLFYTLVLLSIAAVTLTPLIDLRISHDLFQQNNFVTSQKLTKEGCTQNAREKSKLFKIPIQVGFYNAQTQCFSRLNQSTDDFFDIKNNTKLTVFANASYYGMGGVEVPVKCVSVEYLTSDQNIQLYDTPLNFILGTSSIIFFLLLCLWMCCRGCCTCVCCDKKVAYMDKTREWNNQVEMKPVVNKLSLLQNTD